MNPGELKHKIVIEKMDEETEVWSEYYSCRAKVNTSGGNEYLAGGAERSSSDVDFRVRYCTALENMYLNTQIYRILFRNGVFNAKVVDNFKFKNLYLDIRATGKAVR